MKNFLKVLSAIAVGGTLVACGSKETTFKLNGAGATFPAPLYTAWLQNFQEKTGNKVNYQAVGSGAGVRQFTAKTVDFGASDGAVSDKKQKLPMVHIPMTGGAIVPAYNNSGCDAKMTQAQLADVFLGNITNWSEFGCADKKIVTVHRSDGSGTTKGFTNSLSAFSAEWAERVGTGKSVKWPVGVGGKGNSGVAAQIRQIDGSIGYLNYGYVNGGKFQQVSLQNRDGNYVKANAETSAAGLSQIILDDQLRGADPNPRGANAYPIVSLTWILAYPEADNNEAVKTTLRFMLSEESQALSDSLGYVPLPEELRQRALGVVETLK
ncbi:phosphate ABC transporter substrate-binding protein [Synechococcus phage S-B43]|jgi:phosphate transport system substrate-binding protein|nr:phosphate ABC transporter, periplasmic phosphate-binding protein [Synechococcus phage S-H68]QCW22957.1 phosphate ABC transporter substrate-binding protein [Synechococcus phage S-B05]QDH50672.1 phosphate ABC transporter substrate-binding protein [Synechococcus phage S-B43]